MKSILLIMSLLFSLTSCSLFGISSLEKPSYQLISNQKIAEGEIEIRKYGPTKLVSTYEDGEFSDSSNSNFRKLFKYISGENKSEQKISMTTPVFMDISDDSKKKMSFVVPSKLVDDTPEPSSNAVELDSFPEREVAVISFSGQWKEDTFKEKEKFLRQWLLEKGFDAKNDSYAAAYDPPWAVPFLRTNEVHIELNKKDNTK